MTVTAAQVKELRQATGVGMMDCKKALVETGGDQEKAILWLRENGLSRAAKKAGRTTAEGMVVFEISEDGKHAAMLEFNCETDFTARNESFQAFAKKAVRGALTQDVKDAASLLKTEIGGTALGDELTNLISQIGENMDLRRVERLSAPNGFVFGYSHMGGKIGALVAVDGVADRAAAETAGMDIAMHIAASAPRFLNREQVTANELEQEKELARTKLLQQGKPENIIDKILMGQMNKFYSEICLVDQPFVKEPKQTVTQYLKATVSGATLTGFHRFQLGEGIEVEKANFADEVAAQLKK